MTEVVKESVLILGDAPPTGGSHMARRVRLRIDGVEVALPLSGPLFIEGDGARLTEVTLRVALTDVVTARPEPEPVYENVDMSYGVGRKLVSKADYAGAPVGTMVRASLGYSTWRKGVDGLWLADNTDGPGARSSMLSGVPRRVFQGE